MRAASASPLEPIELAIPTKKPSLLWSYTTVLFVTNRKENEGDDDQFFTNISDNKIYLGEACVSYPTKRQPAEQDLDEGDLEAPAKFFTVKGYLPLDSPRDFKLALYNQLDPLFERNCPNENSGVEPIPTLFIHGWRASFTSGITRGAQLKLDLDRKSVIVLSWPADQEGIQSYSGAEKEEGKATAIVQYVMELIKHSTNDYPSVIAHSMGARLYADGVNLLDQNEHSFVTRSTATILAAPDVDFAQFQKRFGVFKLRNEYTTVYCGIDIALSLSWLYHGGRRLGFCSDGEIKPTAPEEMVLVTGRFRDTWRHSYFLSAPEMIDDMKSVIFKDERRLNPLESLEVPSRKLDLR
ncbi:MAG TPA: alpha/beta hydrolase [Roseiarcus sp.]|nr:alpha/beta hydrolase [Roseiarcus sp.]